jgi:hypothetical protein
MNDDEEKRKQRDNKHNSKKGIFQSMRSLISANRAMRFWQASLTKRGT